MRTLLYWPTGIVWNWKLVLLLANLIEMVTLLDWPTGTVWNHNLVSLLANLMQYRLANERVSPSESDWPIKWCPIPIRLANGVPICGPMQHQLANKSLSPSQSDWPMGYLFVVPCNTGWPINHCPHPNHVGQWGIYFGIQCNTQPVGCCMRPQIGTPLANLIEMGTMIDWPTGVAWDHK